MEYEQWAGLLILDLKERIASQRVEWPELPCHNILDLILIQVFSDELEVVWNSGIVVLSISVRNVAFSNTGKGE